MGTLVFDIETVGRPFAEFDDITRQILLDGLSAEEKLLQEAEQHVAAQQKLGLSALTGQVAAIAVLDADTGKGAVYFQAPGQQIDEKDEAGVRYCSMSEEDILKQFWQLSAKYNEFITYNGRCFDVRFMMLRTAVHKMRPTVNLLANRYVNSQGMTKHIDLYDQFTFYGALYGKGMKLHMCCQAFGIETPKSEGDGSQVQAMFDKGRFQDIARYNMADVRATTALYHLWNNYLRF